MPLHVTPREIAMLNNEMGHLKKLTVTHWFFPVYAVRPAGHSDAAASWLAAASAADPIDMSGTITLTFHLNL